jgi:hypothetical protein
MGETPSQSMSGLSPSAVVAKISSDSYELCASSKGLPSFGQSVKHFFAKCSESVNVCRGFLP